MSAYVYVSQEWSYRLQRLICLKYYDVLKQESRFAAWLNAVKNTDCLKNDSKQIRMKQ